MKVRPICILRNTTNWPEAGIPGLTGYELCIQLTRGYLALIDADDLVALSSTNWCALVHNGRVYAARKSPVDSQGKSQTILMHRQILKPLPDQDVDHQDQHRFFGFKLVDNRRENLRNVSRSQNLANQRKTRGSSRFKGVSWHKPTKKWRAQIRVNRRLIYLGLFTNESEAALAYNTAHQLYFPGIQEGKNFVDTAASV